MRLCLSIIMVTNAGPSSQIEALSKVCKSNKVINEVAKISSWKEAFEILLLSLVGGKNKDTLSSIPRQESKVFVAEEIMQ